MDAAALAPVAIERHGKVQAIVAAPRFFSALQIQPDETAARRLARLDQTVIEKNRLIRHQRIAFDLLTVPDDVRAKMIGRAQGTVARWQCEGLCSADYIDRWSAILLLPVKEMAIEMTSDANAWGPALRQNSPWVGVCASMSVDLDCYSKDDSERIFEVVDALGENSPYHAQHGYYLDAVGPNLATLQYPSMPAVSHATFGGSGQVFSRG